MPAVEVWLNRTKRARRNAVFVIANADDLDRQFVSEHARVSKERLVALKGVQVRAAYTNATHACQGLALIRRGRRLSVV